MDSIRRQLIKNFSHLAENLNAIVMNKSVPDIQLFFPLPMARQPLGGLGRLIFLGFTITHFLDTPHLVGLLWMRNQLIAETST
jgi:hypothetical protein